MEPQENTNEEFIGVDLAKEGTESETVEQVIGDQPEPNETEETDVPAVETVSENEVEQVFIDGSQVDEVTEDQTENNEELVPDVKGFIEEVSTANYKITGLVDVFDEQGIIKGQFPVDSIQELPVVYGDRMVEEGQAEKITE